LTSLHPMYIESGD